MNTKQCLNSFIIADCKLEPEIEISDIIKTTSYLQKGTPKKQLVCQGKPPILATQKLQVRVVMI